MKWLLTFFLLLPCLSLSAQDSLQSLLRTAHAAHESGDRQGRLAALRAADQLRPLHPSIMPQLAQAYAALGRYDSAALLLHHSLLLNTNVNLTTDALEQMKGMPIMKPLVELKAYMSVPVQLSDTAMTLPLRQTHVESIAFDGGSGSFFFGSVRDRVVWKRTLDGGLGSFGQVPAGQLYSILATEVDIDRGLLWVSSCATPFMAGYADSLKGQADIWGFDLKTGEAKVHVPIDGPDTRYIGTLVPWGADGLLFSDSEASAIYQLNLTTQEVTEVVPPGKYRSLQGIAVVDAKQFFFADYSSGVYKYNNGHVEPLALPAEGATPATLKGIDGLYYRLGTLLAIQNGTRPMRLMALQLGRQGNSISSVKYLEKATPGLGEPTQGVLVGDVFYYVANSQWQGYVPREVGGKLRYAVKPLEDLPDVLILKVDSF